MNERSPLDRYDEQLEWDRDGQYYHYLTKWMHALSRMGQSTGDSTTLSKGSSRTISFRCIRPTVRINWCIRIWARR
jgi:hypothetical protein